MTEEEFEELVGMAIGSASMAWTETPKGVFDSDKCRSLVLGIISAHKTILSEDKDSIMEELS